MYIMEKFKTLNNQLCKIILRNAVNGLGRAVYLALYNNRDMFTDELFERIFSICNDICPLLPTYKTLPNVAQNFYNLKWLNNEIKF